LLRPKTEEAPPLPRTLLPPSLLLPPPLPLLLLLPPLPLLLEPLAAPPRVECKKFKVNHFSPFLFTPKSKVNKGYFNLKFKCKSQH
jgi:hypothetical protein